MTNSEIIEKAKEEITLRGLTEKTSEEYLKKLTIFMEYYDNQPINDMSEDEIRAFLLYQIEEKHNSASTVNTYNSALRFVFGAVLGRTLNYQKIPRRRIRRELPQIMTKSDIVRLFECVTNIRDKAILMVIYGSGLRMSEIVRLRVQDVDSANMRVFVHQGKGGKDRYTLLSQNSLDTLREYWRQYRPNHPDGYLFPNKDKSKHIHIRTVQEAFNSALERAGIQKDYSVHTLRHCFATHLLENGVDVCRIKQLMGHTHIQSTTFYLHLLNFDGSIKSPLDTLPKKRGRKPKAVAVDE
jgi:site-specific recombinase XerD